MRRPTGFAVAATLTLLSLIWGTTWAAIRIGLAGIPPFTGVSLRFAIGGATLFVIGRALGMRASGTRREKALWVANGLLSFCASYGIVYWAEQWVPSGLASVLFATFPLFVALLAHFALPAERLGPAAVVGIAVGFSGVAVLFSEDLGKLGGPGVGPAAAVMLLSPLASAIASVSIKKWGKGIHAISLTAVPMGIAGAVMGGLALIVEHERPLHWTAASVGALLYLALAGSALTFTLYYWLLSHLPATRLSLIAYTTPVVAVAVGAIFMNEPFTRRSLAGSALVVAGVALSSASLRRLWRSFVSIGSSIALAALLPAARAQESGPLRVPADPSPAAVRDLGAIEGARAFTLSGDGSLAAAAFVSPGAKRNRSIVRVADGGGAPRETELDGTVRALRFGPGGEGLYAILARESKKRGTAGTSLVRLDPATLRTTRSLRVPITATSLDLSADAGALLVACRGELRVALVPNLESPRLFAVPGDNLSVGVLAGGDRVLVGQRRALVLVSLSDPQKREGLPVRERLESEQAVVAIAAAPDGSAALARLEDGRTLRVSFDPLRVEDAGVSAQIAWNGPRAGYAPPPDRAPAAAAPIAPPAAPSPADLPPKPTIAPPNREIPAVEPGPAAPRDSSLVVPAAPAPKPEPPPSEPPVVPTATEGAEGPHLHGRITGTEIGQVRAIVVFGPDNVLREAARIAPRADGWWSAGPLAPGTYRIVLDAGGDRSVLSDPPFVQVRVAAGEAARAPELRVVRVLGP